MLKQLLAVSTLVAATLTANTASAFCLFNCDYTKTKYPVVLAPGVLGFDKLVGFVAIPLCYLRRSCWMKAH